MDVREMLERSQDAYTDKDPLGLDATRAVARSIMDAVRDPKMHPSIAMKVARAVTERKLSAAELTELCDYIVGHRKQLRSPGAYFVTCIKRVFQRNEIAW